MVSGGVASPYDPIANVQYSEEELRAIVEEAEHWKTYVMAHAYTAEAITHALNCGVRTIEHANLIDLKTARLATSKGAYIVPTLITYFAMEENGKDLGLPEVSIHKLQNVLEYGLRSLEVCKEAGTKVGFGTDLLGPLHSEQRREFKVRSEVLSSFEILESATKTTAAILGMAGELGEIIPGALADLLVLEGNPLDDVNLLAEARWRLSRARTSARARTGRHYRRNGGAGHGPPVNLCRICIASPWICQHYRRCGASDRGPPLNLRQICIISSRMCQRLQRCRFSEHSWSGHMQV